MRHYWARCRIAAPVWLQVVWALARSALLRERVSGLTVEVQLALRDRLDDFSSQEVTMLIRDLASLGLMEST